MTNYYLAREIELARAKHQPISIEIPAVPDLYPAPLTVKIPPAQLWEDEVAEAAAAAPVAAARMLLGEHYEHFKAAGGRAGILFEIIRKHGGAASVGESSQS